MILITVHLHREKSRADDEKAIDRLYKDVHNGGLRRKRGNDFDLSDAEDEEEARRRRRQQEYKRMRQALYADEKIGAIGTFCLVIRYKPCLTNAS